MFFVCQEGDFCRWHPRIPVNFYWDKVSCQSPSFFLLLFCTMSGQVKAVCARTTAAMLSLFWMGVCFHGFLESDIGACVGCCRATRFSREQWGENISGTTLSSSWSWRRAPGQMAIRPSCRSAAARCLAMFSTLWNRSVSSPSRVFWSRDCTRLEVRARVALRFTLTCCSDVFDATAGREIPDPLPFPAGVSIHML